MCLTEVASDSATLKMTAGDVNVSRIFVIGTFVHDLLFGSDFHIIILYNRERSFGIAAYIVAALIMPSDQG